MRPVFALILAAVATHAVRAADEPAPAAKVALADLNDTPEKFAGRTVEFEGVVEETPRRNGGVLRLERSALTVVCEGKPEVVAGDRVRVVAVCERVGKSPRVRFVATLVERVVGNESALFVTLDELRAEPKKFDGKLLLIEGVVKNAPEAVAFGGEMRYTVRLGAGVAITCHGRPLAARGDRVRVYGNATFADNALTPLTLDANAVEIVPR
jgi:hypothetical protein